jgi:type IV secretion system protein VirD4
LAPLGTHFLHVSLAALAPFSCLWAATEWAATRLSFQPALGPAWIEVLGLKIYAPWKLFSWWIAFGQTAPDIFAGPGLLAAFGGIAGAGIGLGGAAWRTGHRPPATTYGSARWADTGDIRHAKLFARDGVVLGLFNGRYLRHDGPEHVLLIAPTRSGKGVGVVLPTLLSWTQSAVIHDIKGENWALTAGWRARFSHCLLFDPTNARSARFNPLLEVRKGAHEVRDVQNIADILVDPEGARDRRDHWDKAAHALLTGAILHVLYAETEKTLSRVASLLADPARSILRTLNVMLSTNHVGSNSTPAAHPVVAAVARELLNKSENERSGVVSTALSFLSLYRDPIIGANTATCDWRIADLTQAERPVSLYLVVPPSDISRTKPLVRLLLNQIVRQLTESPVLTAVRRRQLLLMIDEFPALGRLEFFESSLAFLAGYGVRAVLVAQSLNQIDKAYGPYQAILDNCHVRVAFTPNDERTAKRLSDTLGTATELRALKNLSGRRLAAWLSHTSVSEQETPRALLTVGEILQLKPSDALVLVSGLPPIRAGKLKYYTDHNFRARRLPPPALGFRPYADAPPARAHDWSGPARIPDPRLAKPATDAEADDAGPLPELRDRERPERSKAKRPLSDLPLLAGLGSIEPSVESSSASELENDERTTRFPGPGF